MSKALHFPLCVSSLPQIHPSSYQSISGLIHQQSSVCLSKSEGKDLLQMAIPEFQGFLLLLQYQRLQIPVPKEGFHP